MKQKDERVAVFGAEDRIVRVYHRRLAGPGHGVTVCGRVFDSTCRHKDAIKGGLRACRGCYKKVGQ